MKDRRAAFNQAAAALMAAVPHGRVEVVADTGHLVPQENPAATHAAILEILTAVA